MYVTTGYGTWVNYGDQYNVSVEGTILTAINGGDTDWQERMEASGALARIASDYRDAIDDALPAGISISGDDFIGVHHTDPNYTEEVAEFDIAEAIRDIDLNEIIKKHDVDN